MIPFDSNFAVWEGSLAISKKMDFFVIFGLKASNKNMAWHVDIHTENVK